VYTHARNVTELFPFSNFLFFMNITIQGNEIMNVLIAIKSFTPEETYISMRPYIGKKSHFLV
jgi:hypothetical protein